MRPRPLYEFSDFARGLLIGTHLEGDYDAKIVGKSEGTFGDVYRLQRRKNALPRFLAAKCPKIVRFGTKEKAASALKNMLHEVEKTYTLIECPWVNQFSGISLICGWPFLISQWQDGTLSDLIANPLSWRLVDRLASVLQIVRVMRMASEREIVAHQDLKPDNIFYVDLHKKAPGLRDSPGLHFQILVSDFGNADAFREFGRNCGSRPYMAPEQFGQESLESTSGTAMDTFAVGVLAHECFCDGLHPIGAITSDVWPRRVGVAGKWDKARTWRNWAQQEEKDLSRLKKACPTALFSAISAALNVDPTKRPDPKSFEAILWETLKETDVDAYRCIDVQVREMESMYEGGQWSYFEEKIASLREFYAGLS